MVDGSSVIGCPCTGRSESCRVGLEGDLKDAGGGIAIGSSVSVCGGIVESERDRFEHIEFSAIIVVVWEVLVGELTGAVMVGAD